MVLFNPKFSNASINLISSYQVKSNAELNISHFFHGIICLVPTFNKSSQEIHQSKSQSEGQLFSKLYPYG